MILSSQLSKFRKEVKMTQEYLAEKCDVSRQAVAKWESGDSIPDLNKIIMLADIFDMTLDDLILGKDSLESKKRIARKIYGLYIDNMENFRTYILDEFHKPERDLEINLRATIKKSRTVFSENIVEELLVLTEDFGTSCTYVYDKEEYKKFPHYTYSDRKKFCDCIIPQKYKRVEEILGEYLELS